ncbi:protein of unknown function DUF490 [Shewanella denitrificans OS217]|uniref:Translocation and assembly module TamB C-terminal domain-containing protein n=1 Tax=Shewanella denitrificans (strain OS217 / ATCC BAA-1090 / DSM 15013) TaxID=318161 RepID=Q12P37_SHEDO|nr:translocation/assembly module TamB domain-containing protein [Shewanella denitrificans]ABE54789.1 protein of unknown function DUF490 [Shewanella denitrificans OS217]
MSHESPNLPEETCALIDTHASDNKNLAASSKPKLHKAFARLLKWLKHSLRLSLYLPLALLMLLALMLGTPMGSHGAIILANNLVADLELEYLSGTLNREISLSHASYRLYELSIEARGITFGWQPSCLLNWQVCIQNLSAQAVSVSYQDSAQDPSAAVVDSYDEHQEPEQQTLLDTVYAAFEMPMAILLSHTSLKKIEVKINDMDFKADEVSGTAIWNSSGLTVRLLESQGLDVSIPQTTANTPSPSIEGLEDLSQFALTDLPQITLPFPIRVKRFIATQSLLTLGERQDSFSHIELKASMKDSLLRVSDLQLSYAEASAVLTGQLAFSANYPLEFNLALNIPRLSEFPGLADQKINLGFSQDLSNLKLQAQGRGQSEFNLQADIALTSDTLDYQLSLTDSKLQWPLSAPQYHGNIEALMSSGNIHSQQLSLLGDITAKLKDKVNDKINDTKSTVTIPNSAALPSSEKHLSYTPPESVTMKFDTQLKHQNQMLTVQQLTMSSNAGQLNVSAEVNYHIGLQDNLQWHALLGTQGLQLQQLLPLIPNELLSPELSQTVNLTTSMINGSLTTQGEMSAKAWQVSVTQANLSGNVNGYPLYITGDISADSQFNLQANALEAQALGASLSVHGEVKDQWDVKAKLDVPDISQWLSYARGSITATANIGGPQATPLLTMQTELSQFSAKGASLDYVQLLGSYSPKEAHQFTLKLTNNLLNWKKHQVTNVSLLAQGDISQQSLTISSEGELAIKGELNSQYQQLTDAFSAELARLSITTKVGQWQLNNPAKLEWQQGKGSISPFCLQHPQSRLCLVDPINIGKQGQLNLAFSGNPGQLLAPVLSKKMRWDGEATLAAQVHWREGTRPTAKLDFALLPGNITLIRAKNNLISLDYQTFNLAAQLDEKALSGQIGINSEGIAQFQSQFSIANDEQRSLSGEIDVNHLNLQPFGEFFPQLATLEGVISTKLLLAGTLAEPDISGNIRLVDGAVALASNPTLMDKIYLDLALSGQQGNLSGHWFMGKGEGKVLGTLSWPQGQFSGELAIAGDSLAFIQPPLAILDVSPAINLNFNRQKLSVTGDINVPSGQIKIVPLADGGVPVSTDVVFNDSISAQEIKTSPYAIIADLNISVGKGVLIDGLGLTGKLGGKLVLKQKAFKPPLLYGDIKIRQGSYRFMGQSLKISTGEVQFVGSAENPNLNIQAVRQIKDEDLTAGVRITGTPLRPVVTLFSTPAKEQAEILSYILKGTGFTNSNNQQNNALMMSAALSLGSQFDGGAINSLGSTASGLIEKFGFSNVQLDANDEGRVALSGYIGEDLMVKYGMGVFNPGYEMTVRYYLLSQLYLETVSGTLSQSLDLYYSFDIE